MPDTFAHAADVFGASDEFTLTTLFGRSTASAATFRTI